MCCHESSSCWLLGIGVATLWWVVASVLVYFVWNRVLATLFKLSKIKWWHPFLVIATVAVLVAPCALRRGGGMGHLGGCAGGMCAHHAGGGHDHHASSSGHSDHADCKGECQGGCEHKCEGKCKGGECEGGNCPHHHGADKK